MNSIVSRKIVWAGALALAVAPGALWAADKQADYTKMSPEELADYLILEKKGFDLDQKTQEGGTVRDRLTQDKLQKTCSELRGGSPDAETAAKVTAMAKESVKLPEGGIKLGDWKKGEKLAESGFGFRVGHNTDDHSDQEPGGNCQACHQLDPTSIAYGTLGPSLTGYGATRGTSDEILEYTYNVIYNPHTTFPCTKMPRFGANEFLTREQILDIMAYLLDPASPVNQ